MAEAEVGAIVYRFKADVNPLKAGFADAQAQMRALSSSANDAGRKASDAATQAGRAFKGMADQISQGALATRSGMLQASASVEKFNAGLDRVREFAWNNTGFSGDQIDRVINPIQSLGGAIGVIPTIAASAALATAAALALIGAKAQGVLAELQDQARQAGVTINSLRGAEILGARAGLSRDDSRGAVVKAAREFEQFKRDSGAVKDNIEKIDEKFLDLLDKTRNFGQFFDAVVQKIRQLPQEEGLDLSKALLGEDAGKRLFEQIRSGALDMRALSEAAQQSGGSIDEAARRAEEMKRQIDEAAALASQKLLVAFQSLDDPISSLKLHWFEFVGGIADAITKSEKLQLILKGFFNPFKAITGGFNEGADAAAPADGRSIGRLITLPADQYSRPENEALLRQSIGVSRARYAAREKDESSSSRAAATDQIKSYIEGLKQAEETAKAEAENWGKSNVERAQAVALAKAQAVADKEGKTLTDEQRQSVLSLAGATQQYKDRVEELKQKQQELNAAMREFADAVTNSLSDLIVRGRNAKEVMADLARTLASSALRGALTGQGMFGNLFGLGGQNGQVGGLFGALFNGFGGFGVNSNFAGQAAGAIGPFPESGGFLSSLFSGFAGLFADGGNIPAGQWGIAGERGPEIITGPASVIPVGPAPSRAQDRAPVQHITFNVTSPDAPSFARSEPQISALLARAAARGQRNI
jgi:hypothetical protein